MLLATTQPAAVPLDEIDLYAPAAYGSGDLHGAWRTLRAEKPVWRQETPDGTPFWSVTRYSDVVDVLRDTGRFSSEYSTMLTVLGDGDPARGQAIHLIDPPKHGEVRGHAIAALTMRALRRQEERIAVRVRKLVADTVAEGEFDFAEMATLLPMVVAGEAMGIPEDQWQETARWTVASMAPEDPAFSTGDPRFTLLEAHTYLFALFDELIHQRRKDPGEDLISLLTTLTIDGRPATDEEAMVNCYAFLMGANPTVPQASAQFVLHMAKHPDLWKQVRDDTSIVPALLEELLRWASPINHLLRRTTEEVVLGDEVVPEGGLVAAWVASANRDESVFTDPYSFDPLRQPNAHISFGFGAHRCIGQATASVGLELLIRELIEQVETIEQTGPERHLASNFLNGVTCLPIRVRRTGSV